MDSIPTGVGDITTAGAYVLVDGVLAFVLGPNSHGDGLAVVRLGGHREQAETGWECAAREVREEASLEARPLVPPATYWLAPPHDVEALDRHSASIAPGDPVAPVLVAWRMEEGVRKLSVMYLAATDDVPTPANEVRALILLRRRDVLSLVTEPVTLGQFLKSDGRAIISAALPTDLFLEPFLQLRALAVLLQREPDLLPGLR